MNLCITPSYDGSGQAMHPDVIDFKTSWNGYRYWMAETPFTDGDSSKENPSVVASNDGVNWIDPGTNPLVPIPVVGGFYSDPELLYNNETLHLLYRWVEREWINLFIRASKDGRNWDKPVLSLRTKERNVSSPSVVWDGNRFLMYSADSFGGLYQRTSLDLYSEPIKLEYSGLRIWHLDVIYDNGFVMIATDGHHYEWLGFSQDGIEWQFEPEPRLRRDKTHSLYRACLSKTEGGYDMWYSVNSNSGEWNIARMFLPK